MASPAHLRVKVLTRNGHFRTCRVTQDRALKVFYEFEGGLMLDKHYPDPWGWWTVAVRNADGGTMIDPDFVQ